MRCLTNGDLFADPVPEGLRIDFGARKVIPLGSKSDPLGSKSVPLGPKSDPLASKSDPQIYKNDPLASKSCPETQTTIENDYLVFVCLLVSKNNPIITEDQSQHIETIHIQFLF